MSHCASVFAPLGFKSDSIDRFNPSLWSQRIGWRPNIFQQLLKCFLIRQLLSFKLSTASNISWLTILFPVQNTENREFHMTC